VDLWAPLENYFDGANVNQDMQDSIMKQALAGTAQWRNIISVCRNFTALCAPLYADASFDFVYVDARHDRQGVTEDLTTWWPKIRPGGLMCGHDFVTQNEGPAQHGERWCGAFYRRE
jgi:predicted O-methyltransferase YrrM